jgi:hypothetical protein
VTAALLSDLTQYKLHQYIFDKIKKCEKEKNNFYLKSALQLQLAHSLH